MKLFGIITLFSFAGLVTSLNVSQGNYNYGQVLGLSHLFYEAQRCGKLPQNNRIEWRGDSFLNDGADMGIDLSGGYFDAGDHVKFGFPAAGSATVVGWGLLDYKDGYVAAGEYENGLAALKWFLDYMIKTHPSPNVIWAQVGDGNVDHSYWGRPEEWPANLTRPSTQINETAPGSDLAGEYAAAFAVGSLVFKDVNSTYASECLRHARELYAFATKFRGKYSDTVGGGFYGSYRYEDELFWAAGWLYRATLNATYLADAKSFWSDYYLNYVPVGFGWDDKLAGAQVLLANLTGDAEYVTAATKFCDYMRNNATRTPKNLVWLGEWGSLRSISTVVYACLVVADSGIDSVANRALAKEQIDYILGDNGRSYVVGYGNNPPIRPHHRASSCPNRPAVCNSDVAFNNPGGNPQTLYGALVGGPDVNDFYEDLREDYVKNEVALDYNAGFHSALAALSSLRFRGIIP